jgi:hypothetical protein
MIFKSILTSPFNICLDLTSVHLPSGFSSRTARSTLTLSTSIYLSVYLSISLPIYLSISLSVNLPIYPSIRLSVSVYLSVYLTVYLSVCLSISLSIYLSIRLSVCMSVRLSVCPSVRLPARPSVCPSVHLSLAHLFFLGLMTLTIRGEEGKLWSSYRCRFSQPPSPLFTIGSEYSPLRNRPAPLE